jgi:DNA invertase Pin-like site-specific DNA recombinase
LYQNKLALLTFDTISAKLCKMYIGYCRISTADQNLDLQIQALKEAGCEKIFEEVASGAKDDRPKLKEAIEYARKGDVIVVWKLDRLSRSLKHLIETVNDLEKREIGFKCITQNLDTTSPSGKLIFHVFGAISEFERSLIRERTAAGLKVARARGRLGGRPKVLDLEKITIAQSLYDDGKTTVEKICSTLGISRATFYRYVKQKVA